MNRRILLQPLLIILLFRAGISAETLTLEESISEALENNLSIMAAGAEIREAEAEKGASEVAAPIVASTFTLIIMPSVYSVLDSIAGRMEKRLSI